ncbi:hypothetical protein GCM10009038_31720 [Salinicola rhizosphaerae]|uniref:Uncharacterized protein n=1 Tax=Salinicola rhizosphaerae TaxID=1443141 RepID=A0ABQ3E910_9GAMM|nr:hypothetical protein GCM10009038_31720 [Salinicola rhizosphaerae]
MLADSTTGSAGIGGTVHSGLIGVGAVVAHPGIAEQLRANTSAALGHLFTLDLPCLYLIRALAGVDSSFGRASLVNALRSRLGFVELVTRRVTLSAHDERQRGQQPNHHGHAGGDPPIQAAHWIRLRMYSSIAF